jgi:hypothetical protein
LTGDSLTISSVLQALSRHYIHYHQDETALAYAQQALNYRGSYDLSLLKLFAQCYTETGDLDKAQQYLNAIPSTESKESQLVKLGFLHRISAKTGDADATQEYFDSAIDVAADMYLNTQKEKLDLQRRKLHEEMERLRAESRWNLSATCLVFSLLLLTLIVWLFIKYHRAKKAEIEHQKIQNRSLEELNKKEKELFHAEKARLLAEETMLRKEKEQKEQIMERTRFYVKSMVSILREVEQYRT